MPLSVVSVCLSVFVRFPLFIWDVFEINRSFVRFIHCVPKSDAKIKITITTEHLIRINYPLSSFNYRLSGTNVANFKKIHHMVSEKQL